MRICFISYEYPPDTGIGGIGTYINQVSQLFSSRKIDTEVICASDHRSGTFKENEFLTVTRIKCKNREEFRQLSPVAVASRHAFQPLDIIEVPEYGAEGLHIKEKLPSVPLVVKLHTPGFLIKELNNYYYDKTFLRKLKKIAGLVYKKEDDPEYQAIQFADYILSPSHSIGQLVSKAWNIAANKIFYAPNPYFPPKALYDIPYGGSPNTVLYIGRLETRKGVYNLSRAIPTIIKKNPEVQFVFVGKDGRGPFREKSMKNVMQKQIGQGLSKVRFIDHVPLSDIPGLLSKSGICVFPSLWENFPNVCLEAMTATRGIVASGEGGMQDMLADIDGGILIDPHDPASIANGILEMTRNNDYRRLSALRSREKIINYYSNQLFDELKKLYNSFIQGNIT